MKKFLITTSIILLILFCSWISLLGGLLFGSTNPGIITPQSLTVEEKEVLDIQTNDVYITSSNTGDQLSYVPDTITQEQQNDLLDGFEDNFRVVFDTNSNSDYRDFFAGYDAVFKANVENANRELEALFDVQVNETIVITFTDSFEVFNEYTTIPWPPDTQFAGVVEGGTTYMYILFSPEHIREVEELVDLVSHEMVHIYQNAVEPQVTFYEWPPSWFDEGMADYLRTGNHTLPEDPGDYIPGSLAELEEGFFGDSEINLTSAYAYATMFYAYLDKTYGTPTLIQIYDDVDDGYFDQAFKNHTTVTPDIAYANWLKTADE